MRSLLAPCLVLSLLACSPDNISGDPRDRVGAGNGIATWGMVQQGDGIAAFLSRPGAAPDVVLWCRNNVELVVRAHIFKAPSNSPDLHMTTKTGAIMFEDVRRQGGVRAGDRILVEGSTPLNDPKVKIVIMESGNVTMRSGNETYNATNADTANILPPFLAACDGLSSSQKANP